MIWSSSGSYVFANWRETISNLTLQRDYDSYKLKR